jgi:hypothetical protein
LHRNGAVFEEITKLPDSGASTETGTMKIIQGKVLQEGHVVLDNLTCKIKFHSAIVE